MVVPINDTNQVKETVTSEEATAQLVEYIQSLGPATTGVAKSIQSFLDLGADSSIQVPLSSDAVSLLHLAAFKGNSQACSALLQRAKIPWNSLSSDGKSVGEIALESGYSDLYSELVSEGVRTEFVLGLLGQRSVQDGDLGDQKEDMVVDEVVTNASYLNRKLTYSEGKLLDEEGNAVMMGWETPLMELHAAVIAPKPGLNVLNVGFGLGIIDTILQERHAPRTHTIIEAHPDVYKKMIDDGWDRKPGVRILFGRWQDVLVDLETYDGIFFDTFGEYYDDLKAFHDILPNILREDGIYSFFNGLAGTNSFFHDVACQMAELDLRELGLVTKVDEVDVDSLGDEVWRDCKRAYWSLPKYRVPTVTFDPELIY